MHSYDMNRFSKNELDNINEQLDAFKHSIQESDDDIDDRIIEKEKKLKYKILIRKREELSRIFDRKKNTNKFITDNEGEDIKRIFALYKQDKKQILTNVCIAYAARNDDELYMAKILSQEFRYNSVDKRKEFYDILLHTKFKAQHLTTPDFMNVLTATINMLFPAINTTEISPVVERHKLNGFIFIKKHKDFKNSKQFAKLFESTSNYNRKNWGKIYTTIKKWIPKQYKSNKMCIINYSLSHEIVTVLKSNNLILEKIQVERIFSEYNHDDQMLLTNLCDAYAADNDIKSSLGKLLSDFGLVQSKRKQFYDIFLHTQFEKQNLNTANFSKILKIAIVDNCCDLNFDEVYKIVVKNNLNGHVFIKGHKIFKKSTEFAKLFKNITNYKLKKLAKLYVTINKWKTKSYNEIKEQSEQISHAKKQKHSENESKNTENDQSNIENKSNQDPLIYSQGLYLTYWKSTSNHAMYVPPWYKNLKQEITHSSSIFGGSIEIWNQLHQECENLMKTDYVKQITTNGNEKKYDIASDSYISIQHIYALQIYTGYTEWCSTFCSMFRLNRLATNNFESTDSFKRRNVVVAHLARLLIETVQVYGEMLLQNNKRYTFYRGVNQEFIFPKYVSRYHLPLSTTTDFKQAAQFASRGAGGLVIEFRKYCDNVFYFNCSSLSIFDEEQERLFFGGETILKVRTIYQAMDVKWSNYKMYIDALQNILDIQNHTQMIHHSMTDKSKAVVSELIEHVINSTTERLPDYISTCLQYYFSTGLSKTMIFNLTEFLIKYKLMKNIFIKKSSNTPNISNVCKLWRNCESLTIYLTCGTLVDEIFCRSIIEDITQIPTNIFLKIACDDRTNDIYEALTTHHEDELIDLNWRIGLESQSNIHEFITLSYCADLSLQKRIFESYNESLTTTKIVHNNINTRRSFGETIESLFIFGLIRQAIFDGWIIPTDIAIFLYGFTPKSDIDWKWNKAFCFLLHFLSESIMYPNIITTDQIEEIEEEFNELIRYFFAQKRKQTNIPYWIQEHLKTKYVSFYKKHMRRRWNKLFFTAHPEDLHTFLALKTTVVPVEFKNEIIPNEKNEVSLKTQFNVDFEYFSDPYYINMFLNNVDGITGSLGKLRCWEIHWPSAISNTSFNALENSKAEFYEKGYTLDFIKTKVILKPKQSLLDKLRNAQKEYGEMLSSLDVSFMSIMRESEQQETTISGQGANYMGSYFDEQNNLLLKTEEIAISGAGANYTGSYLNKQHNNTEVSKTLFASSQKEVICEYKKRIKNIYRSENPEKIGKIDGWLNKYSKEPHELYIKICQTYDIVPKPKIICEGTAMFSKSVKSVSSQIELRKYYKEKIANIYRLKNPQKLNQIEDWMNKYKNNLHGLYTKICSKYNIDPLQEVEIVVNKERISKSKSRANVNAANNSLIDESKLEITSHSTTNAALNQKYVKSVSSQVELRNAYKEMIENIYQFKNAGKVNQIEEWMNKYEHNLHELYIKICGKYNIVPHPKIKIAVNKEITTNKQSTQDVSIDDNKMELEKLLPATSASILVHYDAYIDTESKVDEIAANTQTINSVEHGIVIATTQDLAIDNNEPETATHLPMVDSNDTDVHTESKIDNVHVDDVKSDDTNENSSYIISSSTTYPSATYSSGYNNEDAEHAPVVIDNGTGLIKAGFAGDD
eukprot:208046_1